MRARWLVSIGLAACQGGDTGATSAASGSAAVTQAGSAVGSEAREGGTGSDSATAGSAQVASGSDDDSAPSRTDDVDVSDVGKAIAELGAIPAWQAVVARAQLTARLGAHGVVFGTLGPPIEVSVGGDAGLATTPYAWLADDTEGNGALAIRVALGAKAGDAKAGDRVALGGAWALDPERTWFWKADAVSPLPAAPTDAKDPRRPPGHAVMNGDLPAGAKPISKADEGDVVWFQVVGAAPASDGDGWPVADELGNPVYALLDLPGERASYGAQDMRTSDERWQLKRGSTYVVRIGPVHHHGSDKPATIHARTAPIRVK
jgi:hypothetical protein